MSPGSNSTEHTEYEPDELNPSLYSFHSNIDEKNKLLYSFSQQGIETVVDRVAKKNRIKDWIQSSVITEEDEFEVHGHELKTLENLIEDALIQL